MLTTRVIATTSVVAFMAFAAAMPAAARAVGSSFNVQGPEIKAPERGSIAGAYGELSIGPASVSRGSYALPLPVELPKERGASLVEFVPSYSPQRGLSAWGMGWGVPLDIHREPLVGDVDYNGAEYTSPWGRLVAGEGGKFYDEGLKSRVVVTAAASGWRAVDATGTVYEFAPGVMNGTKVFSWDLVRATSVLGGVTELTYEEVDSQRMLKKVTYGSAAEPGAYVVDLTYEGATLAFVSYRSGRAEKIGKRVKTVSVKRGGQERWKYTLTYKESGFSPAFYLVSVQKQYGGTGGGTEPAITYAYKEADRTLEELAPVPMEDATRYVRWAQDVSSFSLEKVAAIDANRDGLVDFERAYDGAMLVKTGATWVAQPLPARPDDSYWTVACRPNASASNLPRTLVRFEGENADIDVVRSIYQGPTANPNGTVTPAHTTLVRCERSGRVRWFQELAGNWQLSSMVRLTDVNRDHLPDLLRVDQAGYEVAVNGGNGQGLVQRYAGALKLTDGRAINFTPQRLWLQDLNGDGLGDIVVTDGASLYVWYGLGGLRFVERAVSLSLYRQTNTGSWTIDTIGNRVVTFMDVNNDGLTDVLLADGVEARLYASWGHVLVFHATQAFAYGYANGWRMESPIVADLDGDGDEDLVYAGSHGGVPEVQGLRLSPAGTGLLSTVNDGKGNQVTFTYTRGPIAEGVGVRPVVLASLRIRTVGLDATRDASGATRFGELVYSYDYSDPVLHTETRAFQGFGGTLRRSPEGVEVTRFHHDDQLVDVVESSTTYPRGAPWVTDATRRLYHYERSTFTRTSYAGVPFMRLDRSTSGWGQYTATVGSADYYWTPPEPHIEVGGQVDIIAYEGLCPKSVVDTNSGGTQTTETVLAAPGRLAGALHCLASSESVISHHADGGEPADDFDVAQTVARNAAGQVTSLWRGTSTSQRLVQTVEYDTYGRVTRLAVPGKSGDLVTSVEYTGALPKAVTSPDGVRTEVASYDQLTDQIRTLSTDRGATAFQSYFEYDAFERLAKQWDSTGTSSATAPLVQHTYTFATDMMLGRIEDFTAIAPVAAGQPGITRRSVSWESGTGKAVAEGAYQREGWVIGSLSAISRAERTQRGFVRSPIVSSTAAAGYDQLFDGAQELGYGEPGGTGQDSRTRATIAEGVEKNVTSRFALTTAGLQETVTENGTFVTVKQYNAQGGLAWVRDAGGLVTTFHHDAAAQLRAVILPDGTTQRVEIDSFGHPTCFHRSDTGDVVYVYDAANGTLDRKDFVDTEGVTYRSVSYAYDAVGRTTSTTERAPGAADLVTTRYYDGGGPTGSVQVAGQRGYLSRVVGPGFSKETRWNTDGTRAASKIRVGAFVEVEVTTTYYADHSPRRETRVVRDLRSGRVIDQAVRANVLDANGRLDSIQLNGNDLLAFDYDSDGRVSVVDFVTGESIAFDHDRVTRTLNGFTHHTGNMWSASVKWTMNARGFVEREDYTFAREAGGTAYTGGELSRVYEYNGQGQLHRALDGGVESAHYDYDARGLAILARDEAGTRTIGHPRDRDFTVDGVEYVYDAAGRLVKKGALALRYAAHGDIAEATGPEGTFRYYYDDDGLRILKTRVVEGVESPYAAYVGGEYITATSVVTPLVVEGRVVGVIENGRFRMLATDPRGTVLADSNGTMKPATPYGVRPQRPDVSEAVDYAEKGFDPHLGLVRMGVRDYDPTLGQFTRPDPLFMEDLDRCSKSPGECNLFGYAGGNPVMFTDPQGTDKQAAMLHANAARVAYQAGEYELYAQLAYLTVAAALEPEARPLPASTIHASEAARGMTPWLQPLPMAKIVPGGGEAPWMAVARSQLGVQAYGFAPGKDNPIVMSYWQAVRWKPRATDDNTAWCSAFASWVMSKTEYTGAASADPRSWYRNEHMAGVQEIDRPVVGAVCVLVWGPNQRHVGFVAGVTEDGKLVLLGGNQGNGAASAKGIVNYNAVNRPEGIVGFFLPAGYSPSEESANLPIFVRRGGNLVPKDQ